MQELIIKSQEPWENGVLLFLSSILSNQRYDLPDTQMIAQVARQNMRTIGTRQISWQLIRMDRKELRVRVFRSPYVHGRSGRYENREICLTWHQHSWKVGRQTNLQDFQVANLQEQKIVLQIFKVFSQISSHSTQLYPLENYLHDNFHINTYKHHTETPKVYSSVINYASLPKMKSLNMMPTLVPNVTTFGIYGVRCS